MRMFYLAPAVNADDVAALDLSEVETDGNGYDEFDAARGYAEAYRSCVLNTKPVHAFYDTRVRCSDGVWRTRSEQATWSRDQQMLQARRERGNYSNDRYDANFR